MKKKLIPIGLCLLAGAAMLLNACNSPSSRVGPDDTILEDDPVSYAKSEDAVVDYKMMTPYRLNDDELKIPNKLTLHYINDDQECESRRFYTWVTGYDGVERKPDVSSPTAISITLDFSVITEYADMPSIFFIIKGGCIIKTCCSVKVWNFFFSRKICLACRGFF